MKNYKRILAVLLSVLMILGTVCLSVSAEEDVTETVKVSLDSNPLLGGFIDIKRHNGTEILANVPDGSSADEAYHAIFSSGNDAAQYTLTAKNLSMPTDSGSVRIEILNSDRKVLGGIDLKLGEEKSFTVKTSTYNHFIRFYNSDNSFADGGEVLFSLTRHEDPESDMMNYYTRSLEKGVPYEGSIIVPEDVDVFSFSKYNQEDFKCVIEPQTDTVFLAELYTYDYDTEEGQLVASATGDETITLFYRNETSEPFVPYRLKISSADGGTGNYKVRYNDVRLYTDTKPGTYLGAYLYGYGEDTGTDYVKFTTLERDAYYNITLHNINIKTGASADEYLQGELLDENFNTIKTMSAASDTSDKLNIKLAPNAVYYVKVHNGFAEDEKGGNYGLNITYDFDEDRGLQDYAFEKNLGEVISGKVETSYDKDWFKLTTSDSTKYLLVFENKSEEVIIKHDNGYWEIKSIRAEIIDENGEELETALATGEYRCIRKVDLKPNTTYYIRVYDPSATIADYDVKLVERLMLGDANLDESVKIQDATLIQKSVAKLAELEEKGLITSDVNADGKINVKDATAIQKYIAKMETPYEIGKFIV